MTGGSLRSEQQPAARGISRGVVGEQPKARSRRSRRPSPVPRRPPRNGARVDLEADMATRSRPSPVSESPAPVVRSGGLTRARGLARLLDDLIRIPGTNIGIGLDPVIGLIPGVGDVIGGLMS